MHDLYSTRFAYLCMCSMFSMQLCVLQACSYLSCKQARCRLRAVAVKGYVGAGEGQAVHVLDTLMGMQAGLWHPDLQCMCLLGAAAVMGIELSIPWQGFLTANPMTSFHPTTCLCCALPACAAAADENNNGTVERAEFPQFIFHMAIADLKSVQSME